MADAYLKVKDNGAQGLALVRESSEQAQETLGVSDLKTQLGHVLEVKEKNIYNPATDTLGYRLANAGYEIEESSYNSSDYIDISGMSAVWMYAEDSVAGYSDMKFCFYDSSKNNIADTYKTISIVNNAPVLQQVTPIPQTAKYMRFHYENAKISKIYIGNYADPFVYIAYGILYSIASSDETKEARDGYESLGARLDAMNADTSALDQEIDVVNGKVEMLANFTIYENLFDSAAATPKTQLATDGSTFTNNDYSVSDYIGISGLETVYLACNVSGGAQTLRICYYNSEKSNISGSIQNISIGNSGTYPNNTLIELTVPNNAAYLRFHYYTSSVTMQFVGDWDNANSYKYITYGRYYITSENKLKLLEYWGDSLTQGNQDSTGVSRPSVMSTLLGSSWQVENYGVGGEASNAISARASGIFAIITPGITIPANGSTVDLTGHLKDTFGNDISFGNGIYSSIYAAWITVNPCYVNGVECVLQKANASSPITIKRAESGDAVNITRPTYIVMDSMKLESDPVLLICIGQNEGFDRDADQLISQIDGMIAARQSDRYIVFGMINALYGYTWQAPFNEKLKIRYGRNYCDIEAYMKTPVYDSDETTIISSYALQDAGLTPTATDLTYIAANRYPPSIMYDELHFNRYGYTVWANREYEIGKWLGYWE